VWEGDEEGCGEGSHLAGEMAGGGREGIESLVHVHRDVEPPIAIALDRGSPSSCHLQCISRVRYRMVRTVGRHTIVS
jgi:hypothetical protein